MNSVHLVNRKITQRSLSLPADLSNAGKSRRIKWDLVRVDSLPEFLNDNEYLLEGHRPELNSISECLKSIFVMHTETINVWTHLLGALAVTWLYLYHISNEPFHWHHTIFFSLFFLGAIVCMTVSAVFHTLLCHSEPVFKLFAKLDYCGVILLITTSYSLWLHFGFYCFLTPKIIYLLVAYSLACLSIFVVVQDRFCQPQYMIFRAGLFIALGSTAFFPGVHFIISEHYNTFPPSSSIVWLVLMGVSYLLGGLAYAVKVPERFFPGKCDVWCQSHQILHVAVVIGVLICYKGASILADERNKQTC